MQVEVSVLMKVFRGVRIDEGLAYHVEEPDSEVEVQHEYISDSELSLEVLSENIKDMINNSVERKVNTRTTIKKKRKRAEKIINEDTDNEDFTKAYSRCSVPYIFKVFESVKSSEHRKALVQNMGFEHTLELDECYVPRAFAQWIADNTRTDT